MWALLLRPVRSRDRNPLVIPGQKSGSGLRRAQNCLDDETVIDPFPVRCEPNGDFPDQLLVGFVEIELDRLSTGTIAEPCAVPLPFLSGSALADVGAVGLRELAWVPDVALKESVVQELLRDRRLCWVLPCVLVCGDYTVSIGC